MVKKAKSIGALFYESVKNHERDIALVDQGIHLSYKELHLLTSQVSDAIEESTKSTEKIPFQEVVAVCTEKNRFAIASMLGIMQSGRVYLPIDLDYPEERVKFLLEDSEANLIIVDHDTQIKIEKIIREHQLKIKVLCAADCEKNSTKNGIQKFAEENDIAYLIYTSGSTGTPKGVEVEHRQLFPLLNWCNQKTMARHCNSTLQYSSLSFDPSLLEILTTLLNGKTLFLIDSKQRKDISYLLTFIIENKIERLFIPIAILDLLSEEMIDTNVYPTSIKEINCGGDKMVVSPSIRQALKNIPKICLNNQYGPTEASIMVTNNALVGDPENWIQNPNLGEGIDGVELLIIDEHLEEAQKGELLISGEMLARGYKNRADLTAEKFIILNSKRYYRTGDFVTRELKGICFLGRKDNQIKINGVRLEKGEVENIIEKFLIIPQVVVEHIIENDLSYLVAFFPTLFHKEELRSFLLSHLPSAIVPNDLVEIKEFPLTSNGKIDHKHLRDHYLLSKRSSIYSGKESFSSSKLLEVFKKVLGKINLSEENSFFEMGGTSLQAINAVRLINKISDVKLTIADFYAHPSVSRILQLQKKATNPLIEKQWEKRASAKRQVAIVGMSCRFPHADNLEEFWKLILNNRNGIDVFSMKEVNPNARKAEMEDRNYVFARGMLKNIDQFDAPFFEVSPRMAEIFDPQMRILLEESVYALEAAGISPSKGTEKIGVFVGMSNNNYLEQIKEIHPNKLKSVGDWSVALFNEKDYVATHISHKLNLNGPSISIHTACSTSLVAIITAYRSILNGDCDVALSGGVNINSMGKIGHLYSEGGIHSKDGQTRSFDKFSSGTVFSDGVGVIVLKDLEKALEDGDQIYALIKGASINNDGKNKTSFTAPSVDGQKDVIQSAILDADIDPYTIELVEAHGTGTPIGDPIEVQALCEAWKEITEFNKSKEAGTALGSIKSQIGHTIAASGVAGVIKAALAMKNEILPATINFTELNPLIDLENSPFYINVENKKWNSKFMLKRAAVSSFGVGGTNAHLILEEYNSINKKLGQSLKNNHYLFCYSARTIPSLHKNLTDWKIFLENKENDIFSLEDLSYSLYIGRNDYEYRVSFVVESRDQLIRELNKKIEGTYSIQKVKKVKSLWGFSGQGENCFGLGMGIYRQDEIFRDSFDECLKILREKLQLDLWEIINNKEEQIQTSIVQPYIFIFQYSMAKALASIGAHTEYYLGHSLGEYVVGVLNGVFTLEEALFLIVKRGQLMQSMPLGAMLSIGIPEDDFNKIIQETSPKLDVEIAVFNAKDRIVVSGENKEIARLEMLLKVMEIKSKKLKTSHAFHSSMMVGMLDEFDKILDTVDLKIPPLKIVSTVTSHWEDKNFSKKSYWKDQIVKPVRFWQILEKINLVRIDQIIDFGPRNVFTQLCLQTMELGKNVISLSANNKESEIRQWLLGIGKLWEQDTEINLIRIFKNRGRKVSLPLYSFERISYWAGWDLSGQRDRESRVDNSEKGLIMENKRKWIVENLMNVFSDISGMKHEEINPDSSFLELGFDSLMLTQVALETERVFQIRVSFRQLLESFTTINLFAEHLSSQLQMSNNATENAASAGLAVPPNLVEKSQMSLSSLQNISLQSTLKSDDIQSIMTMQLELMKAQIDLLRQNGNTETKSTNILPTPSVLKKNSDSVINEILGTVDTAKIAFGAQARISTTKEKEISQDKKIIIQNLMKQYIEKTRKSKEFTQNNRSINADPRVVTGFRPEIKEVIYPIVVNRSKDQHLWDLDGNEYVDMICGFGSNFFGNQNARINKALHEQLDCGYEIGPQHELVGDCASLICEISKMERAAFCNTGSEAVLGALRISRTITGRKKVVMFKGSYHGINDEVIVRGLEDGRAMPAAAGINRSSVADVIVLDYGTDESLLMIRKMAHELAAIIVEPVQSRRTNFRPIEFLKELRKIADDFRIAFIFDEVITGFRIAPGGAQEYFGIHADIVTYGKIIGGGMPIGVIAGSRHFLDALDGGFWQFGDESTPLVGLTYFAGTFVRHPLALRAMREALLILKEGGQALYENINRKADEFAYELNLFAELMGAPLIIDHFGGVLKPRFLDNGENYDLFFLIMRMKGIHCYDGFPWFITLAHTDEDLKFVMTKYKESIIEMQKMGFFPKPNQMNLSNDIDFIIPPKPGVRLGRDDKNRPCWIEEDKEMNALLKKNTK